ncbi:hypothetical protein LV779_36990 [Streptomyces thinghirensis]|nr:hypothetical protein [Streptomyces thinghirensis]
MVRRAPAAPARDGALVETVADNRNLEGGRQASPAPRLGYLAATAADRARGGPRTCGEDCPAPGPTSTPPADRAPDPPLADPGWITHGPGRRGLRLRPHAGRLPAGTSHAAPPPTAAGSRSWSTTTSARRSPFSRSASTAANFWQPGTAGPPTATAGDERAGPAQRAYRSPSA